MAMDLVDNAEARKVSEDLLPDRLCCMSLLTVVEYIRIVPKIQFT